MKDVIESLKLYFQDILTILLPGAFVALIILRVPMICNLREDYEGFSENAQMVAFLSLAYFIGHYLYYLGGKLDDLVDDRYIQKRIKIELTSTAEMIKDAHVGNKAAKAIGAFKFSCGWLLNNRKEMAGVVERHIAESKFFRSMVVALIASVPLLTIINWCSLQLCDLIWLLVIAMAIYMAFTRYMTQRVKSIGMAYTFLIIAEKEEEVKKK